MELQYLKNLKRLETNFASSHRKAFATATIDDSYFYATLNVFNNYELIQMQDKDFEISDGDITETKLGTALIIICSEFNQIEQIITKYIDLCANLKHGDSDLLMNLRIIEPLFSELSNQNKYFKILKDFEIKEYKESLKKFKERKESILDFKDDIFNEISKKDDSGIFKDIIETNNALKEYIITENSQTFTLDYLKTYLYEFKEFIKLLNMYCNDNSKDTNINQKLFIFNILNNSVMNFTYPLSKIEPKIKIDNKYVNAWNYETNYLTKINFNKNNEYQKELFNSIHNHNVELFTTYRINTIKELLMISFIHIIENKIPLRICQNCHNYFIPENRSDEVYCNRVSPQKANKTCKEYGAKEAYRSKVNSNDIKKAHYNAGQYFRMKIKRCTLEKEKQSNQKLFNLYKKNYEKQRKKFNSNKLSEQEFIDWIIAQKQ